jgi:phosphoserine phosphatase
LELIRPTRAEVAEIGRRYVAQVEPTAQAVLAQLRAAGWVPLILSGGFRPAIQPLAEHLGGLRIEAVELHFNADGTYRDFDREYPTTRNGGKPEVITRLRRELQAGRVVMVGDGVSDLETQPVVDLFVGFGRYAARPAVQSAAEYFIHSFQELPPLLQA